MDGQHLLERRRGDYQPSWNAQNSHLIWGEFYGRAGREFLPTLATAVAVAVAVQNKPAKRMMTILFQKPELEASLLVVGLIRRLGWRWWDARILSCRNRLHSGFHHAAAGTRGGPLVLDSSMYLLIWLLFEKLWHSSANPEDGFMCMARKLAKSAL